MINVYTDKETNSKLKMAQKKDKPRNQCCTNCCAGITGSIRKVQRFRSWSVLMCLSLALFLAIMDAFSSSERGRNVIMTISLSGISFGISFIIASMHYLKCTRRLTGNLFEFFWSLALLSLWIAGAFFILNPNNNIATSINEMGVESIRYSNIYGLTWLAIFSCLYLVLSFYCDVYTMNPKVVSWIFVFSASITLVLMSSHLKGSICALDIDGPRCDRTKYSMLIGAILLAVSVIALLLFVRSEITPRKSLVLESVTAVLYGHGVVMITSVNGPASNFSTMYFAAWCGALVSCLNIINSGHEQIELENIPKHEEKVAKASLVQVDMGGQIPPSNQIVEREQLPPSNQRVEREQLPTSNRIVGRKQRLPNSNQVLEREVKKQLQNTPKNVDNVAKTSFVQIDIGGQISTSTEQKEIKKKGSTERYVDRKMGQQSMDRLSRTIFENLSLTKD